MNSISKKLVVLLGLSGLFVGNSFAVDTTELRNLYAELRTKQGEKKPQWDALYGLVREFADERGYQEIFNTAEDKGVFGSKEFRKGTGLNAMYTDLVRNGSFRSQSIGRIMSSLDWVAYLQNKHGKAGVFTYDGKGTGTDNPVLGTYRFPGESGTPITCYGFLEGLFQAIDREPNMSAMTTGVPGDIQKALMRAINK